jgi:phosphoribosylformylglycinamidine synthase PurS subunit
VRVTVLVRPKEGILDPQGQAVGNSLRQLGFDVADTHVGRLVEVELQAADEVTAREQAERMCEQLLANSLIESYEIEVRG